MPRITRRDALKLGVLGVATSSPAPASGTPFILAFGSCNKPALAQPLWAPIDALRPSAWLWLGDIVYADTEDVAALRSLYQEQKKLPAYAAFAAAHRVLGIWDDHDYGANDAGAEYPKRVESQAALLDFLDEPQGSPRRRQAGIYTSYVFGSGTESVKLILLDGRFHRENPGADSDTLGEAQWTWLEAELLSSRSRVNLIASSYQVLPQEHQFEKWADFPKARRRLLELLRKSGAPGIVLLSGDRHFAELSRLDASGVGYPLYELTSSGMSHSYSQANERNRYRVGALFPELNFGAVRVDFERGLLALEVFDQHCNRRIHEEVPLGRLTKPKNRRSAAR
jgi:alkaline phosphatase D